MPHVAMQREPSRFSYGPPPLEEDEAGVTFATRLGTVVGGGVFAAAAASLPPEWRVRDGGSILQAVEQWLALAAILTPLSILVVAVLRRGRVGLQILAGPRAPLFVAAALWWAVLELGVLSLVGSVLRAKTHHHGLAGVTFAMIALVSGISIGLLAARGVGMMLKLPAGGHRIALIVAALATFIVMALIGIRTSRVAGIHTAAALFDSLALLFAGAIASTRAVARWRPLAVGGVPLATAILLLGFACIRAEPNLKELLTEGAPVQALLLGLLGP